jgi:hypothetical protein
MEEEPVVLRDVIVTTAHGIQNLDYITLISRLDYAYII